MMLQQILQLKLILKYPLLRIPYLNNMVYLLQSQKKKLEQVKVIVEAKVASIKAKPLYPNINQLTELLVTSLKPKLSKLLSSYDFASRLPTELKELPSKIIGLSREIKELKQHIKDMEIELPGDLKEIPSKLENFNPTITNLLSYVAELKNIQLKLPAEPNGDALRKCILSGPYKPTTVLVQAVAATDDSLAIPEHTTEIWEAIERLQQGKSLNIQDVNTNLFWEFGKFTSHDGETMESCYTRFYKLMNEMIRNNLTVATMQVNVQFLQQLQPEWSRFVAIVMQQHKLDEVSYHKLFDILKQYQKKVNELRAKRLARNANPLRDKDMQKNLALIAKYFKKIYKPTNYNLRTSSNLRNKNVDMTLRYKIDNQSGQFRNQRTVNVVGARENVGRPIVQQFGIQCFNCKEFRHFAKECRKPKRVKDSAYHKEKMLLCIQAEQGVPLQAEQYDWLADTD
nr:hypothetical protein [Tanacetum cinerariifolium]